MVSFGTCTTFTFASVPSYLFIFHRPKHPSCDTGSSGEKGRGHRKSCVCEIYKRRLLAGSHAIIRLTAVSLHERMCRYFRTKEVGPMSSRRMIPWTLAMAYCGFLIAGRGSRSFDNNTISEAIIGAVLGFLLAFLFTLRAKRKESELEHSAKSWFRFSGG